MAQVIIELKIMPEEVETDLNKLEEEAKKMITHFGGEVHKVTQEPVAFGLKGLNIIFIMDESKGSTETLEDNLRNIEGVSSVEVASVRRAIG